jgi:hypothetical protein
MPQCACLHGWDHMLHIHTYDIHAYIHTYMITVTGMVSVMVTSGLF